MRYPVKHPFRSTDRTAQTLCQPQDFAVDTDSESNQETGKPFGEPGRLYH